MHLILRESQILSDKHDRIAPHMPCEKERHMRDRRAGGNPSLILHILHQPGRDSIWHMRGSELRPLEGSDAFVIATRMVDQRYIGVDRHIGKLLKVDLIEIDRGHKIRFNSKREQQTQRRIDRNNHRTPLQLSKQVHVLFQRRPSCH